MLNFLCIFTKFNDTLILASFSLQVSRMLAPKCALEIRVDALDEETNTGIENWAKLEHKMKRIEDKVMTDVN